MVLLRRLMVLASLEGRRSFLYLLSLSIYWINFLSISFRASRLEVHIHPTHHVIILSVSNSRYTSTNSPLSLFLMCLPELFVMWVGEGARERVSEGAAAVGVDTAEERGVDDRVPRRAQICVVPLHSQNY